MRIWYGMGAILGIAIAGITSAGFAGQEAAAAPPDTRPVATPTPRSAPTPARRATRPTPPRSRAASEQVKRGMALLRSKACTACHSLQGSVLLGPTLYRLYGQKRQVLTGGKLREIVADEAYLRRSITHPRADLVKGYESVLMPHLPMKKSELDALIAAMKALSYPQAQTSPPASSSSRSHAWIWILLGVSAVCFVFGHLGLSSLPVRKALQARLGEGGFVLLYSVLVLAGLLGLVYAWSKAPYVALWTPSPWTRYIPLLTMPFVAYLFIAGFTAKSPTIAGQENTVHDENVVQGVLKITRHPALWAFALWGIVHLLPNGDLASTVLFGSVIALALLGMLHIDYRRCHTQGEDWERFASQTSRLPFVAMLQGKVRFAWSDVSWFNIALALGLYILLLVSHQWGIGVSPYPW